MKPSVKTHKALEALIMERRTAPIHEFTRLVLEYGASCYLDGSNGAEAALKSIYAESIEKVLELVLGEVMASGTSIGIDELRKRIDVRLDALLKESKKE